MSKKKNQVIIYEVERDLGNGLKMIGYPAIFDDACLEMGIEEPTARIYFSCAIYFARCAHESIDVLSKQVTLEEETDHTASLMNVMEACMAHYGVGDKNILARFFPTARAYAFKTAKAWNPRFQAWIDSAGRAYDEQTREEGAWNTTH